MKTDEFAFFNQQLAAMVRDGIPLETALKRLCADMRHGTLRAELEKLEADLAKGTPLRDAVKDKKLPGLYRQMLEVAAQSNDLPGILTLLADHYQRRHVVMVRLKGLMVYPVIVLVAAFLLSCFLSVLLGKVTTFTWGSLNILSETMRGFGGIQVGPINLLLALWIPPFCLGCVVVAFALVFVFGRTRRALRWRLPAFKEASLAQIASAMTLMLRSGVPLNDAFGLLQKLERGTPAENDIAHWQRRLIAGQGKAADIMSGNRVFPPLFAWTVSQAGEDLAAGFQRAAETYQARASYQTEMLLYSALPCSVLALGLVILAQIQPVLAAFMTIMDFFSEWT